MGGIPCRESLASSFPKPPITRTAVLLGFLLLKEWPLSAIWAIGTLVGVNMLLWGFALISIGSAARRLTKKIA